LVSWPAEQELHRLAHVQADERTVVVDALGEPGTDARQRRPALGGIGIAREAPEDDRDRVHDPLGRRHVLFGLGTGAIEQPEDAVELELRPLAARGDDARLQILAPEVLAQGQDAADAARDAVAHVVLGMLQELEQEIERPLLLLVRQRRGVLAENADVGADPARPATCGLPR
jgi:hypothetical protein